MTIFLLLANNQNRIARSIEELKTLIPEVFGWHELESPLPVKLSNMKVHKGEVVRCSVMHEGISHPVQVTVDVIDTNSLKFNLVDKFNNQDKLEVEVEFCESSGKLWIGAEGYSDFNSQPSSPSYPIAIEFYEGNLGILAWDNINNDCATEISMAGARESKRE